MDLPNDRSLIGTPLVVDGVMYFTGSYSRTSTRSMPQPASSCGTYDPKVIDTAGDRLRIMWDSNRGLAYYKGKVIISTVDGRLIALDAKTGKMLWETMTIDPRKAYYVTGAPKVFRDKVIIGNGGTEHEAARGYVTAYDIETGKQAWRFYMVPGNPADGFENKAMEMAAKTWTGEWWKHGGGGNVWNGITYDAEFNQVLIGTGNGSPWNQKIRSPGGGDNLFLCSIVALDADTGEYKWHYQTNPGETWDYNSNMDIVLADVKYGGQTDQGPVARAQERLLLRHQPRQRRTAVGREVRQGDVGRTHRSQNRPAGGSEGRALRGRRRTGVAEPVRRPQLACDVL
jgi:quinohemoprotein ethanol dehydrogenase